MATEAQDFTAYRIGKGEWQLTYTVDGLEKVVPGFFANLSALYGYVAYFFGPQTITEGTLEWDTSPGSAPYAPDGCTVSEAEYMAAWGN